MSNHVCFFMLQTSTNQTGHGRRTITIESTNKTTVRKFKVQATEYVVRLGRPRPGANVMRYFERVIKDLVTLFKTKTQPDQKIGVVIRNSAQPNLPLALSFRYCHQLDAETLWTLIYRAAQSNADVLLEGTLRATIHVVDLPRGGVRNRSRVYTTAEEFINNTRSIIPIKNNDNTCLAHAIIIGLALLDFCLSFFPSISDPCVDYSSLSL